MKQEEAVAPVASSDQIHDRYVLVLLQCVAEQQRYRVAA